MKIDWALKVLAGIAVCGASAGSTFSAEPAPIQLSITSPQNQTLLLSQDPLTRQILQQLTKENGGVKAVVRVANGEGVELSAPEPDPVKQAAGARKAGKDSVPVLTPHPGLVKETRTKAKAGKRKPVKKASEQLKKLDREGAKQDWESSNTPEPKAQPSVEAVSDIY
ncbi:MAG: hypothetical protein HY924_08965 [Elusimicrobia bacterium]|nr:hypothetical protein [Elusimicrobiota bacterium]